MSLNGLDGAAIQEAHAAAVSEPGGWFLLQYASRDEISLLGRGGGGIVEMRNSIAQYEEASPLYGFLRYRRRNVIIKYLPENCSRLVQARVTVHFNAVCERFTPYNTTFTIATAKDLKDTKLSAACSLHTASSSTSSSTSSLRRRRLMEIAEEEEEEERASKRQSVVKDDNPTAPPPVTLDAKLAAAPDASQFAGTAEVPSFTGLDRPSSPLAQYDGEGRRLSSQLSRSEVYSSHQYGKPKVKLAPRPSTTDVSGRPRTSGSIGNQRPVSSIPAGFKLFSKGSRRGRDENNKPAGDRPSQPIEEEEKAADPSDSGPTVAPATAIADDLRAFPVPPSPPPNALNFKRPHTSSGRPASSSGLSVKSVATTTAAVSKTGTSMEKARLLKAMKLREKRRKVNDQPPVPIPTVGIVEPPPSETADDQQTEDPSDGASAADVSVVGSLDDRPGTSGEPDQSSAFAPPYAAPADSAVDVGLSAADQVSVDTHTTDSHPASPLAMSSEIGDSTKASSLSESTDETVQPLEEEAKGGSDVDEPENLQLESASGATPDALDAIGDHEPGEVPAVDNSKDANEETAETGRSSDAIEQPPHAEPTTSDGTLDKMESELGPEPKPKFELSPESQSPNQDEETGDHEAAAPNARDESAPSSLETERPVEAVLEAPQTNTHDASRPATSATAASETSTDIEPTATPAPAVPSIALPDRSRDSQSTIGQETGDVASADAKRARRMAIIDPIRTDLNNAPSKEGAPSELNLSDDESLMEELHSATVEEAKPITVSKSPVKTGSAGRGVRTVSNPIRGNLLGPGDVTTSSARSVSSGAVFLHKMAQQTPPQLAQKKSNIGSSISQRIKALEKLSASTAGAPAPESPARTERPTSTFFSVRRTAGRDASKSPSVIDRASSRDKTPSPPTTQESLLEEGPRMLLPRDRSGSVASRLSVFEGGAKPRGRPESIQVRARIIRDPKQPFSKAHDHSLDRSEAGQLDFRQSPLVVDHKRAIRSSPAAAPSPVDTTTEPVPRRESIQERRMSREKRRSQSQDRSTIGDDYDGSRRQRRSSLSIVKDFIKDRRESIRGGRSPSQDSLVVTSLSSPAIPGTASKTTSRPPSVHTNSGLARRLSISSRRSSMSKDRDANTPPLSIPLSPSLMTETSGSGDDSKSTRSEFSHKKTGSGSKSRTSRFMRRLSSSLSTTRKTAPTISPTLAEEEEGFGALPPSSRDSFAGGQPSTVSYLGDVNVQFPDNLLWKRRTMFLDSQGFLILSTANGVSATAAANALASGDRAAGTVKRYHLSDFRLPYIPEMEVQELPNSVCLDFVEGPGLQLACEDRAGQMNVLQTLLEAHQSHTTFGQ